MLMVAHLAAGLSNNECQSTGFSFLFTAVAAASPLGLVLSNLSAQQLCLVAQVQHPPAEALAADLHISIVRCRRGGSQSVVRTNCGSNCTTTAGVRYSIFQKTHCSAQRDNSTGSGTAPKLHHAAPNTILQAKIFQTRV